jgi:hypothetical protein
MCFILNSGERLSPHIHNPFVYLPAEKGENGKGPFENYNAVFGARPAVTASCHKIDE